jgi:type VI protein secretion system component Hcp
MLPNALARRLSYANVVSSVCLFLVLGGSAYAAASITGKSVRDGSLTSADVKDHSLRARDFRTGALRAGPAGATGATGATGAQGAAGAAAVQPPPVSRAPAGRLTLAGVTGDGPAGTIVVRSVSWSSIATGYDIAAGTGTPAPEWGELAIAKAPDRSSAGLWKLASTGAHSATAKLELLAPGASAPYATYDFHDVTVAEFATHGSGGGREDEVKLGLSQTTPGFAFDASAPLAPLAEPLVGRMTVEGSAGDSELVLDAWSVANAGGGGGGGSAQFGPFVVSRGVGAGSPALFAAFATGKHIKSITLKLLQPGSESVYSTYVLSDSVIASYAVVGDERPLERIGLDAARIESTTPVPGGVPIHTCFDRKLNSTC